MSKLIDKDQVLAALDEPFTTQSALDYFRRVKERIAALPAIPPSRGWTQEQIEDALFHVADDLLSEGGSLDYTAGVQDYQRELRDDILAALPAIPLDDCGPLCPNKDTLRESCDYHSRRVEHFVHAVLDVLGRDWCDDEWMSDAEITDELKAKVAGALPVLETKKETS